VSERGEPDSAAARAVEAALGHSFRDRELLETALTHASRAHETGGGRGNERLEFLGDAVLGLVVARALFESHPDWSEGELTRARAALVTKSALAERARALGLGPALRLGRAERLSAGAEKETILADALEALLGAVYLDADLAAVEAAVRRVFGGLLRERVPARDPKTRLQEWSHAHGGETPRYRTAEDSGAEDDPARFAVEVWAGDAVRGRGVGRSKRAAEREAARDALVRAGAAEPDEGA